MVTKRLWNIKKKTHSNCMIYTNTPPAPRTLNYFCFKKFIFHHVHYVTDEKKHISTHFLVLIFVLAPCTRILFRSPIAVRAPLREESRSFSMALFVFIFLLNMFISIFTMQKWLRLFKYHSFLWPNFTSSIFLCVGVCVRPSKWNVSGEWKLLFSKCCMNISICIQSLHVHLFQRQF